MSDQQILAYGKAKGFREKSLERWLSLAEADREALLELVEALQIGENHFRDFLDWVEEIALRDGVRPADIVRGESLGRISSDPRLGRNDKLKRMKDELRRLRFPRLSRLEAEIRKRIRALGLKPRIQIAVPPALEGGALTVHLRAARHEEMKALAEEFARALETETMKEIFALLGGEEFKG